MFGCSGNALHYLVAVTNVIKQPGLHGRRLGQYRDIAGAFHDHRAHLITMRYSGLAQLGPDIVDRDPGGVEIFGQQFRAAILTVPDRAVLLALSVYALCTGFEKSRLGLLGSGGVILIAMVAAYYLIFLTAPGDPEALMNASVSRLFFQLWPTSIFLLMANLRRFPLRQPGGN